MPRVELRDRDRKRAPCMGDSESTFDARDSGRSALLIFVIVIAVSGWLWWLCAWRPDINFLVYHDPAEWIVYPLPANAIAQQNGPCAITFRRQFSINQVPPRTPVRVRALGDIQLKINNSS